MLPFNAFWKFLRLGNWAWFFWMVTFCPSIYLSFVGSPRDFGGFRFFRLFDHPLHPRHLKSGVPPGGCVICTFFKMFWAVIFIFTQFSSSSYRCNFDKLCDTAPLTVVLIVSPGMTPSLVYNLSCWFLYSQAPQTLWEFVLFTVS